MWNPFKKKQGAGADSGASGEAASSTAPPPATQQQGDSQEPKSDPRKARRFFEYARTVADTRNYDYAIECYINGLRHDPESLENHEALRQVGMKRKVAGGKPGGMMERNKHSRGKTPLERMLGAEYLWAKNPSDGSLPLAVMEHAANAGFEEVAYWAGTFALAAVRAQKRPTKQTYLKIRDLYKQIEAYDKAVEACNAALSLDPNDGNLLNEVKNLDAERTMMMGRYGEEGDFRQSVRDEDKQRALEQDESLSQSDTSAEATIERARAESQANPEDYDRLMKLVRALTQKEEEESEEEAVQLLQQAYENTNEYRFKWQIGDIRMKQYKRKLRTLRQQLNQEPNRTDLQEELKRVANEQVQFEAREYEERARSYPTDMSIRYQLGRRQLIVGDYDNAIASFQEAMSVAKHRIASLRYLGEAFYRKGWYDEAIDTFERGIKENPQADDKLGLDLRYFKMEALEQKARQERALEPAQEAADIGSSIAQTNINYRDIRQRVDSIRKLIEELRNEASGQAATG